ncbi:MAG: alpha/beta hydrolase [Terriglobales bacterium]
MSQALTDLAYGAHDRQALDLFLPERQDAPARLVFFIHGGGWRGGDKSEYHALAPALTRFGYAVAFPNHRLGPTDPHPAQITDVASALGYLAANAGDLGLDLSGICLAGHSSGGHLASLLALHPEYLPAQKLRREQIAGVVSICGVYDLRVYDPASGGNRSRPPFADYLAAIFGTDSATYAAASPFTHATAGAPPHFLAYAERDYPGAPDQAQAMGDQLASLGSRARVLCVPGRDHVTILTGARSMLDPLAVNLALFLRSIR